MVILAEDATCHPRRVEVDPAYEDDVTKALDASHYGCAPSVVELSPDEQIEVVLIIAIIPE